MKVYKIKSTDANVYSMPGANPGEGYSATNSQLFGNTNAPAPPVAANNGFVSNFSYTLGWEAAEKWSIVPGTVASDIMGIFPPEACPCFQAWPAAMLFATTGLLRSHRDFAQPCLCMRGDVAGSHGRQNYVVHMSHNFRLAHKA